MLDDGPIATPSLATIAKEWDELAPVRDIQIADGRDVSFSHILAPRLTSWIQEHRPSRLVDVGCGTGRLTELLAVHVPHVVGIDISGESIRIARERCANEDIGFVHSTIEAYAESHTREFDFAIANMVLMDTPNVRDVLRAISSVLKPWGRIAFTVTHPCFWPSYWGYDKMDWYDYHREIAIRGEFRTRMSRTGKATTHFHRSLESYMTALNATGFALELFSELPLDDEPRFIAAVAQIDGRLT
ncbi:class I SAM-dependent methyltransferase [Amycolatopsis sp. NBC_00355]|uniref:class I SAM-dependent methyltransferase n=1 Tax=Amycolatopsis sp. NBC_00355 TaxID=2975957 RepID=UPI002E2726F6